VPDNDDTRTDLFANQDQIDRFGAMPQAQRDAHLVSNLIQIKEEQKSITKSVKKNSRKIKVNSSAIQTIKDERKGWNNALRLIVLFFVLVASFWSFWMLFVR
jgi:hypothetical protein